MATAIKPPTKPLETVVLELKPLIIRPTKGRNLEQAFELFLAQNPPPQQLPEPPDWTLPDERPWTIEGYRTIIVMDAYMRMRWEGFAPDFHLFNTSWIQIRNFLLLERYLVDTSDQNIHCVTRYLAQIEALMPAWAARLADHLARVHAHDCPCLPLADVMLMAGWEWDQLQQATGFKALMARLAAESEAVDLKDGGAEDEMVVVSSDNMRSEFEDFEDLGGPTKGKTG